MLIVTVEVIFITSVYFPHLNILFFYDLFRAIWCYMVTALLTKQFTILFLLKHGFLLVLLYYVYPVSN